MNRAEQRVRQREHRRLKRRLEALVAAIRSKEPRINPFNIDGVFNPTAHNAVHLIRGEPDRIIYDKRHKKDYKPGDPGW